MEEDNKTNAEEQATGAATDTPPEQTAVAESNADTPPEQLAVTESSTGDAADASASTIPESTTTSAGSASDTATAKKKKSPKLLVMIVVAILVIAAGSFAALALLGQKDDKSKVLSAISNLTSLQSSTVDFDVTASDLSDGDLGPNNITIDSSFDVTQSLVRGTMNLTIDDLTLKLGLAANDTDLFLSFDGLTDALNAYSSELASYTGGYDYGDALGQFDGAWVDINYDALGDFTGTDIAPANTDDTPPFEIPDELVELFNKYDFFEVEKLSGTKTLGEDTLTGYKILLNSEETTKLVLDLTELYPDALSTLDSSTSEEEMVAELQDALDQGLFELRVWIDNQYARVFEVHYADATAGGVLDLSLSLSNINQDLNVEMPEADYTFEEFITAFLTAAFSSYSDY